MKRLLWWTFWLDLQLEALRIKTPDDTHTLLAESQVYNFSQATPLDIAQQIRGMPLRGNYTVITEMMTRAKQGKDVKIIVLGGSETLGMNCFGRWRPSSNVAGFAEHEVQEDSSDLECAWPNRLDHMLKHLYHNGNINVYNLARHATTSGGLLPAIGPLLKTMHDEGNDGDAIVLDMLVNDAYSGYKNKRMSVVFEQLVRTLHHLSPRSAIVVLLNGCRQCHAAKGAHEKVAEHYGLPVLDFAAITKGRQQQLFKAKKPEQEVHPPAKTHQIIADMILFSWTLAMSKASIDVKPWPQVSLWPVQELQEVATCEEPLSWYSAYSTTSGWRATGDWKLYEDRPGKPGWIAEQSASEIRFPIKFGSKPKLLLTYMHSYEKLGDVMVMLNNNSYKIQGTGDIQFDIPDKGLRVSQTNTRIWDAANKRCKLPCQAGFSVPKNSSFDLVIRSLGRKFKIIEVSSC
eukprot:gnl/TRDRNA2_/TRDRNA2_82579_c0_seq1.p1 gnl/TRDRNA2_/TRDRNA2_82579_c0~~gnl/TRDRNA2_/TRDRNA2_82579_c0_seq1.p1  ORF type:complete len:459 (+),score=36.63 gnl/TRDRNA2_/TRDRNA2_82579_c0_seq1:77-1453(+)